MSCQRVGWKGLMRQRGFLLGTFLLVLMSPVAGCRAVSDSTETSPASTDTTTVSLSPRVSIDEVMVSWINPASYAVWDAARQSLAPKDDAGWKRLEDYSVQLVAAASWITVGGTGSSDEEWVSEEGWATSQCTASQRR